MKRLNKRRNIIYRTSVFILTVCLIWICITIIKAAYNKQIITREEFWSTTDAEANSVIKITKDNSVVSQYFINQYSTLDQFIILFSQCRSMNTGIVHVSIEDLVGNIYYHYIFEPKYMQQNEFCLLGNLEKNLKKNQEYILKVYAEGIGENEYIQIKSTTNCSKVKVFKPINEEQAIFMKLSYQHINFEYLLDNLKYLLIITVGIVFWILGYLNAKPLMSILVKYKRAFCCLMLIFLAFGCVYSYITIKKTSNRWYNKYQFVSHAMGQIEGKYYTNSLEAFKNAYTGGGYRVFEVDFSITRDNKIVLKHDWTNEHGLPKFEEGYIPTLEEFKNEKIWGKYTTLDLKDLIQLMKDFPDIYIITDSKYGDYKTVVEEFQQLVDCAEDDKECLDRIIVQIYNNDMFDAVESVYHFENYIYTLYQRGYSNLDELAEFCRNNDIPVVVLPYDWWNNDVKEILGSNNLRVYLHTINDEKKVMEYFEQGVDGIYTDGFVP